MKCRMAARKFFNNTVANAQQLLSAKDANTVAKLNSELAQPNIDKLMSYSRSVYDLVSEMQKEVTSVMEAQYSSFSKTAASAVEKAKASAPVGGDVFAATMQSMLGASTKAANPGVEETLRLLIKRQSPAAIRDAIVRMMERPDSMALLPSIQVPTLVIVGEEDTLTPPADSEAMAAALPHASLVRIAGAGHMSNLEQGQAFEASIDDFLAGLPA